MNSAQPSIGPWEPPLKYLVISIIWSFFFFTIRWRWLQWWRWSWFYTSTDFFFCPPIFATLDLILTFIQQSKAFGAIAPSSVAFQLQLELFSNTKGPKLRKWKWLVCCNHFHFKNTWSIYCEKTRTGSSSSPPLPPLLFSSHCPESLLTEALRPPHMVRVGFLLQLLP